MCVSPLMGDTLIEQNGSARGVASWRRALPTIQLFLTYYPVVPYLLSSCAFGSGFDDAPAFYAAFVADDIFFDDDVTALLHFVKRLFCVVQAFPLCVIVHYNSLKF